MANRFAGGPEHYDKAIEYAESARSGYVDFRVGTHPGVVANVVSALTQWMIGCPDTARATMQRSLDLARDLDHPYSMAYALHHAGLLDLWGDDTRGLAARTRALREIAEAHHYPVWRALSERADAGVLDWFEPSQPPGAPTGCGRVPAAGTLRLPTGAEVCAGVKRDGKRGQHAAYPRSGQ